MTHVPRIASVVAALALVAMSGAGARAQDARASATNDDEQRIADLVTASHILANEGVLDSFGHASVRSARDPSHFFMPRAMPPALVTRKDIVELDMDCKPLQPVSFHLNGERFIHCEVYKARPDVQSVIHSHDPAVLPFGLSKVPLRPVLAQSGFLPPKTPVFDVRKVKTENKGMLVLNPVLGHALAESLGKGPVVLMRGHGDTVVGTSVKEATVFAVYTDMNAKAQAGAIALGGQPVALDEHEREVYPKEQQPERPWDNFLHRLPASSRPE
jgi:ribulose-5-phosphate 4-epimerase/fuculose-1-phosphate aldolase